MSDKKPPKDPEKKAVIKARNLGGRPPSLMDDDETLKTIRALGNIQCTQLEAAAVLKCTEKTFNRFLQDNEKAREAFQLGKEEGKASLRRTQWKMADRSAAMAIWLGKQWLGQKDKTAISGDPDAAPISVEHGLEHGLSVLLLAARNAKAKRDKDDK